MNRDPVAFLKTPAGQVIREQAGILSADERAFAARRMPAIRTVAIVRAEYDALDAEQRRLEALGLLVRAVFREKIERLEEWGCLEAGEVYVRQDAPAEEIDEAQFARDEAADKRAAMRRDDRLGLGS